MLKTGIFYDVDISAMSIVANFILDPVIFTHFWCSSSTFFFFTTTAPVSYTHLDVYKRQCQHTVKNQLIFKLYLIRFYD